MPSTIFHQSTTWKTLITKPYIDTFYILFQWGWAASNSFWMHDDEILIVPTQSKMEFSCIRAFHDRFLLSLHRVNVGISTFQRILRANENQVWLFSKIYSGISTTWFWSHVEVNDRGSKLTISKSGVTMRSSSSRDLHTQAIQSWRISLLFQELIELLRNKRRKAVKYSQIKNT
jgi:hypothetical protein